MRLRRLIILVVPAVLLAVWTGVAVAQGIGAHTDLKDTNGKQVGAADFVEGPKGVTGTVKLQEGQKTVGPGEHGIHFHEKGDCSSGDFKSAGEHFNPESKKHGLRNPEGPHAGDSPNLEVKEDGSADGQMTTDRVSLSSGKTSLFDSDGSALVIHAKADDQKTDPSGDSGDRQVCGVIEKTGQQELPASGGINIMPLMALVGAAGLVAAILLWQRASHG